MDPHLLRIAVRTALVQRAGVRLDSQTMAISISATCRVLVAQLAPVIGASGLDVLFKRVLHNMSAEYPFLKMISADNSEGKMSAFTKFSGCLAAEPLDRATEAGTEFLAVFAELLTTFIGAPLTERLLAPMWGLPSQRANGEAHRD